VAADAPAIGRFARSESPRSLNGRTRDHPAVGHGHTSMYLAARGPGSRAKCYLSRASAECPLLPVLSSLPTGHEREPRPSPQPSEGGSTPSLDATLGVTPSGRRLTLLTIMTAFGSRPAQIWSAGTPLDRPRGTGGQEVAGSKSDWPDPKIQVGETEMTGVPPVTDLLIAELPGKSARR
jgi:hypothetical protein